MARRWSVGTDESSLESIGSRSVGTPYDILPPSRSGARAIRRPVWTPADDLQRSDDHYNVRQLQLGKPLMHTFNRMPHSRAVTAASVSMAASWDRRASRGIRYKCDDGTALRRLLDTRCETALQKTTAPYKRPRASPTSTKNIWRGFHNSASLNLVQLRDKLDGALSQQREEVSSVGSELSGLQHDIELALQLSGRPMDSPTLTSFSRSGRSRDNRGTRRKRAAANAVAEERRRANLQTPESIAFSPAGAIMPEINGAIMQSDERAHKSSLFAFRSDGPEDNSNKVGYYDTPN